MWSAVLGMLVLGSSMAASRAAAGLSPEGTMCGDKRCSTIEYCSPYDKHCKPCSSICDVAGRDYQPLECVSDCQEYLHDKRYVLLKRHDDLRGEIDKLWIFVTISTIVALLSLLSTLYLVAGKFARWEKMRGAARRAFAGKWIKTTANGRGSNGNATTVVNNGTTQSQQNRRQHQHRKSENDAELGLPKPTTGLKLAMPTISASVAPARHTENVSAGSGDRSASGSGSGIDNVTPNTTSTSLSRRHPSEDTTLDYAYDNPAMTPSPETVQLRTKRESSF